MSDGTELEPSKEDRGAEGGSRETRGEDSTGTDEAATEAIDEYHESLPEDE